MPEITDPQVVAFANEKIRRGGNLGYSFYQYAKQTIQLYNAGNIGSKIDAAGDSNLITDGSQTDGRTRLTGGDIYNFITLLTAYVAFVENGAVAQADRTGVLAKPFVSLM